MPYSTGILARAERRLKQQQAAHRAEQARTRQKVVEQLPRVGQIEQALRQTAPKILAASLRRGANQEEAVAALRRENLALQEEEARLLKEAGYPPNIMEETPFCSLCGDRGWRGSSPCVCLKNLCQKEQIQELSSLLDLGEQSFDTFRLEYYDPKLWPKFQRSPRQNMEFILSACRDYANQFTTYPHKNLFLNGSPGLGKTFLSACIARVVSEKGFSVVYDTAAKVFSRFEVRKFARSEEELRQANDDARRYLSCDLLILDDLGSEFTTPFVQAALYELINTRLIENRHTVISSNLNLPAVRQRYSPQVASRLEGEYLLMAFFGDDIRLLKKQSPPLS